MESRDPFGSTPQWRITPHHNSTASLHATQNRHQNRLPTHAYARLSHFPPLDMRWSDLAHLSAAVSPKSVIAKNATCAMCCSRVQEIYKRIADVRIILRIPREIKEIKYSGGAHVFGNLHDGPGRHARERDTERHIHNWSFNSNANVRNDGKRSEAQSELPHADTPGDTQKTPILNPQA